MKKALIGVEDWTQARKESELEKATIESSKTERQSEQRLKKARIT